MTSAKPKPFNPVVFGDMLEDLVNRAHDAFEGYSEQHPDLPPEVVLTDVLASNQTLIIKDLMESSGDNYQEAKEALMGFVGVTRITYQIAMHLSSLADDLRK